MSDFGAETVDRVQCLPARSNLKDVYTLPCSMLMTCTRARRMILDRCVLVNSDISLQELSDLTSVVDSSGNLQCRCT